MIDLQVRAGPWNCEHCNEELQYVAAWIARCPFCEAVWVPAEATYEFFPHYWVVVRK